MTTAACALAPASLLLAALGGGNVLLVGALALLSSAAGVLLQRRLLRDWEATLAEQRAEHLRFHTAINNISQGLCFFDGQRRLIVCNERYATMYGLTPELIRRGTTLAQILDHRCTTGSVPAMPRDEYVAWRERIASANQRCDTVVTLRDGRVFEIHHEPMADGGWVATHADITEHRRVQSEIERIARSDTLTALPNRLQFRERLNEALPQADAVTPVAVLCIDLDRFKAVNDTLGHPVGDDLLRAAAQRLRQCTRQSDLVARLGGDEFAIIQTGAPQPAAAQALADRLVAAVGAPFVLHGHPVQVGASIGITIVGDSAADADEVLKQADLALYDAKAGGRGRGSLYRDSMVEHARERRSLEIGLRDAAQRGELELHYQPIVGLAHGRIVAFEALLRWRHRTRGLVLPGLFIPLAEETGIIEALGAWVLHEAFREAQRWPAAVGIAVNLSPVQLRNGRLAETVAAALQASGLAPERVDLEITESVRLDEDSGNLARLRELQALGARISLDDFGVGYSSLSYLRSFPFHKIKIDRSFIADIAERAEAAAIVRAIGTLGASLGMRITAEGVENAGQLARVRALGCDEAQGWHLGRPAPAASAQALLERERQTAVATDAPA